MSYQVSIIIPIYRVEDYIERCVLSVMNQKIEDIGIECILIDDKSPDRSIEKAEKLINNYKGNIAFKILRHTQNMGLSAARNTGMMHAIGKYVFFLDSDDDLDVLCLKNLWSIVKQYHNIHMVMGNHLDRRTGEIGINENKIPKGIINNNQLLELYFLSYIPVMAWNCLILRELIVERNLSFRKGLLQEDMLWSSQLFCIVDSFIFVPKVTLYYEYNSNSTMSVLEVDKTRHLPHQLTIINELINSFRSDHWIANTLYIVSELLLVLDVIWKKNSLVDDNLKMEAYELRNKLLKMSFFNYRFTISLFELLMYRPFSYILKYRFFRKNYHKIKLIIYKMASIFDLLHRR